MDEQKLKDLEKRIDALEKKRIYQMDITPGVIFARHMGGGVPYIMSGLSAKRPTKGAVVTQGVSIYFSEDTGVLSIWTGAAWKTVTLT